VFVDFSFLLHSLETMVTMYVMYNFHCSLVRRDSELNKMKVMAMRALTLKIAWSDDKVIFNINII
jgi:hypothetical protein